MGALKHEIQEREEAWDYKAHMQGWRCAICGTVPPHSEHAVYFDTHMCGWCAHMAQRDE